MSPKRGERVAPPAVGSLWDLRFATSEAAKGWDELCRQAPANTLVAYEEMRRREVEQEPTTRHHRLKGKLATGGAQRGRDGAVAVRGHCRRSDLVPGRRRAAHVVVEVRRDRSSRTDRMILLVSAVASNGHSTAWRRHCPPASTFIGLSTGSRPAGSTWCADRGVLLTCGVPV